LCCCEEEHWTWRWWCDNDEYDDDDDGNVGVEPFFWVCFLEAFLDWSACETIG
jgi:hypothetical protein